LAESARRLQSRPNRSAFVVAGFGKVRGETR
jgi:hypothetical protein